MPKKQTIKTNTTSRKQPRVPRVSPSKSKEVKLYEAYERLGVSESDVLVLPKISHILTNIPGGIDKCIEFIRGSGDPDARKFLATYDSLAASVRKLLPVESFCLASGLTTKRTLELITGACFEQSASATELLAAASQPAVVLTTIKAALNKRDGTADRKMLHMHAGFVPVPKSQTTIFSGNSKQLNAQLNDNSVNTNNNNLTISAGEVPLIESKMAKITNRFNSERLGLAESEDRLRLLESTSESIEEEIEADAIEAHVEAEVVE